MAKSKAIDDANIDNLIAIYCRTSREQDSENSTIIQQREHGIKFAKENNFEYRLYEDEGKSGYKIPKGDVDPLSQRPKMQELINDIKDKKIKKVWVWEHSRLARNDFASAYIFKIFDENDIELYEKDRMFNFKDSQSKLMRSMLDAFASYERDLIVARTTRGNYQNYDEGKRSHPNLYCYRKTGQKYKEGKKQYVIWEGVESEINNYHYAVKRYFEGVSIRKICYELFTSKSIEWKKYKTLSSWMADVLRKYQYTGYSLKMAGIEIQRKFDRFEIDDLSQLNDKQYWVKSVNFPLELITIEKWIEMYERLRILRKTMTFVKKKRILKASGDIATSLIECSKCGLRYYYYQNKIKKKSKKEYDYFSYKHHTRFSGSICSQLPKSIHVDTVNEIFKLFYFYFYMVFDNTNELIQETQRRIKQEQTANNEKIKAQEKNIKTIQNKIIRYEKVENSLNENAINETIEIIKRINDTKNDLENEMNVLIGLKNEKEALIEKFNQTEMEMTFYDVKERIIDFFEKLSIEQQRNELIKIIHKCLIFGNFLLIDSGYIIFLFDVKEHYLFDLTLVDDLKGNAIIKNLHLEKYTNNKKVKGEVKYFDYNIDSDNLIEFFKKYFMNIKKFEDDILMKMSDNERMIFMVVINRLLINGNIIIRNIELNNKNDIKEMKEVFKENNIDYDLSNTKNVILFLNIDESTTPTEFVMSEVEE